MEWFENILNKGKKHWWLPPLAAVLILLAVGFFLYPSFWAKEPAAPRGTLIQALEERPVDLNTADMERLTLLKGIGETKARAIVLYREEHGAFHSMEELEQVKGISQKTIQSWGDTAFVSQQEDEP